MMKGKLPTAPCRCCCAGPRPVVATCLHLQRSAASAGFFAEQSVQAITNSSFKCDFYCSNVDALLCCDNIFLPSFFFKVAKVLCMGHTRRFPALHPS